LTDRGRVEALRRALRIFSLVVLPFGVFWTALGTAVGAVTLAALGMVAVVFCNWLFYEAYRARRTTEAELASRIAAGTQVAALSAVIAEPMIGVAIALASLIPVIVALPYVRRQALSWIMADQRRRRGVRPRCAIHPAVGTRELGSIGALLPSTGVVTVYVLFLLFLWNASHRMTDATSELRHVVEMSHDLAGTLDPKDVGHRLARHIAQVAHADDCVLSTWDREGDRVVTFGSFPIQRGYDIEPEYALAGFPATRRVLESREPYFVRVDDPEADPAEVGYLREIGQQTLAMLPFVVRGESIGIVEMASHRPDAFSIRDIELAQMLAREAAVTFDNARLYDELRLLPIATRLRASRTARASRTRRPRSRAAARSQPEPRRGPVHRPGPLQAPERSLRARQGRQGHSRSLPSASGRSSGPATRPGRLWRR
jgi:hypothetical protein